MRTPGLASGKDIGSNLFNAFRQGMNYTTAGGNAGSSFNVKSVGGLATAGGLGGIGMVAGAGAGAVLNDENPLVGAAAGAAVGGAAGMAALPVLGAGVGLAGRGIGRAGTSAEKFIRGGGIQRAGQWMGNTAAEQVGSAGARISQMASMKGTVGMGTRMNPLHRYSNLFQRASQKIGHYSPGGPRVTDAGDIKNKMGRFKLSKVGKGVAFAGAAAVAVKGAVEGLEESRMGQVSPYVQSATPRPFIPEQQRPMDHAGATGDLVFAMNRNRRG